MWPECHTQRNRSRVEGGGRAEAHGPRRSLLGVVGRCDRRRKPFTRVLEHTHIPRLDMHFEPRPHR